MRRPLPSLGKARDFAPTGLISRVADSCFWFGRYVERAEATARHLQASLHLALDGELSAERCWHPAVIVAGEEADFLARLGRGALSDGQAVQEYLVWDRACGVSLARSIAAARDNARSIRDVLSGDVWEVVNEAWLFLESDAGRELFLARRDDFYRKLRGRTQLALGLMRSTMLHDAALDFVWLGVMLERTNQTARLLDVHHHAIGAAAGTESASMSVWVSLLRACSGLEPYMKCHAGHVTAESVAAFLMTDLRFPRSIAYALHAAHERFLYLRPKEDVGLPGGRALELLEALDARVQGLRPDDLRGAGLHEALTEVVDGSSEICVALSRELFDGFVAVSTTTEG